jgi:lysine N6-hydroxylase
MSINKVYDFIGIGIGPFNLGLAALAAPVGELSTLFLDQAAGFDWHPGMMLPDATLQVPFMADLVTLADPCSPYSFLNYMKQSGRLYRFYIRENFFLLRKEYNAYCRWVIKQLPNCLFGKKVLAINYDADRACYVLQVKDLQKQEIGTYYCKKLVLGTGTSPKMPEFAQQTKNDRIIHSSNYLHFKSDILEQRSVSIIGSGQSAAEIFQDLLPETANGLQLNWFTRPDRFFPMEYSKLTLELTSPEYVDHFYSMAPEKRKKILSRQNSLFKGINYDLINSIFDSLYSMSIDNPELPFRIMPNCQLNHISPNLDDSCQLHLQQVEQEQDFSVNTDFVVMCTGYVYKEPSFLEGIQQRIRRTENNLYDVKRNYAIDTLGEEIFVQNAELHTHGFVTPDLGMAAYRNSVILNSILGKEYYTVEKSIAFQQFSLQENYVNA